MLSAIEHPNEITLYYKTSWKHYTQIHESDSRCNTTDLEYSGYDWSNVRQKVVSEYNREVDEHHDVAIADMWSDVCTTGGLHDIWH